MGGALKKSSKKPATFLSELAPFTETLFKERTREQFAALCYRICAEGGIFEVLLVTSRQSGRWIIPKGWPIAGKKPHEVAAIEAFEEAGVRGRATKKPFGYFTYLKMFTNGERAPCCVQVHLLDVKESCDVFREKGQRLSEWVSCVEAARRVREPELKGLFLSMQRANVSRQQAGGHR
ncbi:NUDIX hydrolase [Pararhizobium sp. DWP3-4]|uniref:NUDIX hydrolase n=1 Tax=Pararhizobium sp. DWP3-4 TaxID=2804565 RepID=UPI003CFA0D32